MSAEHVEIRTEDGFADAYVARPADDNGRRPGVLFLVDAFGLRPQIELMADRIAERGFVVLAPNVFYRHGRAPVLPMPDLDDPEARGPFMEKIRPMMQGLHDRTDRERQPGLPRLPGWCGARAVRDHRLLHGRPAWLANRDHAPGPRGGAGGLSRRRARHR